MFCVSRPYFFYILVLVFVFVFCLVFVLGCYIFFVLVLF